MLPKTEGPTLAQMRARIGRAVQSGDAAEEQAARQDYRVAKLDAHIREVVAAAPPLTDEQRDRLRTLLASDA